MVRVTLHFKFWALLLGVATALVCAVAAGGVGTAQQVTQGYKTDSSLQKGLIVRLNAKDGSKVEPLSQTNEQDMLGVVVDAGDAPVSLANPTDGQQVYVATFGQYEVLASTQNGAIKTGDYVTISSLNGIGMRADDAQTVIIGKALQNFDGAAAESTATLDTSEGKQKVGIGRVLVDISVAHNPLNAPPGIKGVPGFLSRAVQTVTDEPISALRVYASVMLLGFVMATSGVILYGSIWSGMRAIGRNPLAKHSIVRSLITAIIGVLIIVIIGLCAVYLLLKL